MEKGLCSFSIFSCVEKKNPLEFRTPKTKGYEVVAMDKLSDSKFGSTFTEVQFKDLLHSTNKSIINYPYLEQKFYKYSETGDNSLIIAYIHNKSIKTSSRRYKCVIFSHDNNNTLVHNYPFLLDLSAQLKVIYTFINCNSAI